MILGQLGQTLMGFIDNIMIGKLGVMPLAAASFTNNLFVIIIVFCSGIAAAISPMVAKSIGQNNKLKAGEIFKQSFVLMILLSILLYILSKLSLQFLYVFGQPQDVTDLSHRALDILLLSIPFTLIYFVYKQFHDGIENSKAPAISLYFGIALNVFLNWCWIYGNWGFPAEGLVGACKATLASRIISILILLIYTHFNSKFSDFNLSFRSFNLNWSYWRNILKIGIPSSLQYLFEVGLFSFAGIMMGWINKESLAAHQIALNIGTFSFMCAMGWSFASSIKIGNALGKKDFILVRRISKNSLISTWIFMLFTAIVFVLGKTFFPSLYIDDAKVIQLASQMIIIVGLFQLADGTQAVCVGLLRGLQDVKIPTLIIFMVYWLFAMPVAYFSAFKWGLDSVGIWIGLLVGLCASAILLCWRLNLITKKESI